MLVQSWGNEIRLLPALPAAWPEGRVTGVRAKGGVELDLEWSRGRLIHTQFRGKPASTLAVRYGNRLVTLVLDRKGRALFEPAGI
jgi:alpha-L-fucosidase 2